MEKRAPANYEINDLLSRRWSPRAFSQQPVDGASLRRLFEAARWAPSSSNEQPWYYLVGTSEFPAEHEKILSVIMEGNQRWARRAPVLMISVARLVWAKDGSPNRHAFYDLGQATADLSIQATDMGLVVHQMGGFFPDRARETFEIPDGYEAVAAIALGYPGDPDELSEDLRARENSPRVRKELKEFVFADHWGKRSHILDD